MNPNENESNLTDIDQQALDAYVQKKLKEEAEKRGSQTEIRIESLRVIGNLLIMFVLGLFIVSPFLQMLLRAIKGLDDQPLMVTSGYVRYYQWTVTIIHHIARFTAVIVLIWLILYSIVRKRAGKGDADRQSKKAMIGKLLPMFVFILFVISIILVTVIRGPNEYDLTGHPYMYESIYSYISYPLVFFFCGMMLKQEKHRKLLLYALLFTSLPINILALVDKWIVRIKLFNGGGLCAVFHNANHYGYYLAITIITAALLFVYEKTMWLKIFSTVCATVATIVLVINNTLGAYLAVLFVLILFVIYSFVIAKQHKLLSVILLLAFLLITVIMSFFQNTILSSIFGMFSDIGNIIEDPIETQNNNHSSGIARWKLWTGTVKYLKDSPFLGFGVEGLLNTHRIGTPHNEFLQYAEFFGIQTSLLYITACALVLIRVLKNCKKLDKTTMICFFVCIGYLASSFFGVAIYYTTPYIYIFLGLTYAQYLNNKTEKTE